MNRKHMLWLAIAVLVIALLSACDGGEPAANPTTTPSATASASPSSGDKPPTKEPSPPATSKSPEEPCSYEDWHTGLHQNGSPVSVINGLQKVRIGEHRCFDRVVFPVKTTGEVTYAINYVDGEVHKQGSGQLLPTTGDAALHARIYAPYNPYMQPAPQWNPLDFNEEPLYPSVRQVKAGVSFEGYIGFAIGVVEKRPFTVYTLPDGDITRIVVDIAH